MVERLIIAAGIAAVLGLARFAFVAYGNFRLRDTKDGLDPSLLRDLGIAGQPAVVYFWTETCGQCKMMQAPALDRLAAIRSDVRIVSVNAIERHKLAEQFSVLTVPTTAVIDGAGRLRAVNHGYAGEQTLSEQLAV